MKKHNSIEDLSLKRLIDIAKQIKIKAVMPHFSLLYMLNGLREGSTARIAIVPTHLSSCRKKRAIKPVTF
jgi:hypothetical protein